MKLKSFGCSFIFGTDLPDDGRLGPMATPSHCSYPALIAQDRGLEYSCHARPGAGNFEIVAQILEQVADRQPAIYIINWTWIDRFSYVDAQKATRGHPFNPHGWQSIMPVDETDIARIYYRDLHSQQRDKLETLICIKSAIDMLRSRKSQFIMTWTDNLIWETKWHFTSGIGWLQEQISPYLNSFDGMNFVEWSKQQGFEISDTMHPLEAAHRAAADMILQNWDQYLNS